jgi:hypothetical protein
MADLKHGFDCDRPLFAVKIVLDEAPRLKRWAEEMGRK